MSTASETSYDAFASLLMSKKAREATRKWVERLDDMTQQSSSVTTLACLQGLAPRACANGTCERYPVRLILSAYMIVRHPDVVLGGAAPNGAKAPAEEEALEAAAKLFTERMEDIAARCADTSRYCNETKAVEQAWAIFVEKFTRWKALDACALERELVRIGVALETSMLHICGTDPSVDLGEERNAVRQAQAHDVELLRQKISSLTGKVGVDKFNEMIAAVRCRAVEAQAHARADGDGVDEEFTSAENLEHRRQARERSSVLMREAMNRDKIAANARANERHLTNDDLCNEQMYHEMLINPVWKPVRREENPEPEREKCTFQSIEKAMHAAFWDSIYASLVRIPAECDSLNAQVCEFRTHVLEAAVCRRISAEKFAEIQEHILAMNQDVFNDAIAGMREEPKTAITALRNVLEAGYSVLRCLLTEASPLRISITERYERLLKDLDESIELDDSALDCGESIARAVVAALSFLLPACDEVYKDALVSGIDDMVELIRPFATSDLESSVGYAREKFMHRHRIEYENLAFEELSTVLPRTTAWILDVAERCRLHQLDAEMTPLLSALTSNSVANITLRSGFHQTQTTVTSSEAVKCTPTRVCSVDGVMRVAFASAITARRTVSDNSWPETLLFDQKRFWEMANEFQLLHALSASIVLVKQLDANALRDADELDTFVVRCSAHMRHEHGRLPDIAKEIKAASKNIADSEETIISMLRRLTECGDASDSTATATDRSSANIMSTVLVDNLRSALTLRLVLGFDDKVTRAVQVKLAKIGSIALQKHVDAIARDALLVYSVTGRVHAPFYSTLVDAIVLRRDDEI